MWIWMLTWPTRGRIRRLRLCGECVIILTDRGLFSLLALALLPASYSSSSLNAVASFTCSELKLSIARNDLPSSRLIEAISFEAKV